MYEGHLEKTKGSGLGWEAGSKGGGFEGGKRGVWWGENGDNCT